ncbi:MAG: HU family DNA-binding protein [Actinomycetota bacterium]|nr:HU family DNA-binding protein [Actinomycetota bacterium]
MNRRELVNAVAAHGGLEPKQVDATLRSLTDVITAVVSKGEPVQISGFAKFAKVERAARMGRNPATGEPVKIKASKKARITPLKAFKDAVMTPSQAPKLAKGVWSPSAAAGTKKAAGSKAAGGAAAAGGAKKAVATKKAAATKVAGKKTAAKRV